MLHDGYDEVSCHKYSLWNVHIAVLCLGVMLSMLFAVIYLSGLEKCKKYIFIYGLKRPKQSWDCKHRPSEKQFSSQNCKIPPNAIFFPGMIYCALKNMKNLVLMFKGSTLFVCLNTHVNLTFENRQSRYLKTGKCNTMIWKKILMMLVKPFADLN